MLDLKIEDIADRSNRLATCVEGENKGYNWLLIPILA